jgi:hypothetical protein
MAEVVAHLFADDHDCYGRLYQDLPAGALCQRCTCRLLLRHFISRYTFMADAPDREIQCKRTAAKIECYEAAGVSGSKSRVSLLLREFIVHILYHQS